MSTEKPKLKTVYSSLISLHDDFSGKISGLEDHSLISTHLKNYIKECCKYLSWNWEQNVLDDLQNSIYDNLIKNLEFFSEDKLQIPPEKRKETVHLLLNVCLLDIVEDFSFKNEIITFLKGKSPDQQSLINDINQCKNVNLSHLEDEHFKDKPCNKKALEIKRKFQKNAKIKTPVIPYDMPVLDPAPIDVQTVEKKNLYTRLNTNAKIKMPSNAKKDNKIESEFAVPASPAERKITSPKRKLPQEDDSETEQVSRVPKLSAHSVQVFESVKNAFMDQEINTGGSSKTSNPNVFFAVRKNQKSDPQKKINICIDDIRKALYSVVNDNKSSNTVTSEKQVETTTEEPFKQQSPPRQQQCIFPRQDLLQSDVVTPESPEKPSSSARDSSQQSRPCIFPRQDLLQSDVVTPESPEKPSSSARDSSQHSRPYIFPRQDLLQSDVVTTESPEKPSSSARDSSQQSRPCIFPRQDLLQSDVVTPESPEKPSSSARDSSQQSRPYIFPRQDLLARDYSHDRGEQENNSNSTNQRKREKKKTDPLILPADTCDVHVEPSDVPTNTSDIQVETRNSTESCLPEAPSGSNMEAIDSMPYNYQTTLDDLLNSLSFRQTAEELLSYPDEDRQENGTTTMRHQDTMEGWNPRNEPGIPFSGHHRPYVSTRLDLVNPELRPQNFIHRPYQRGIVPSSSHQQVPQQRNSRYNSSETHRSRKTYLQKYTRYNHHY